MHGRNQHIVSWYKNLQPLSPQANAAKGGKYEEEDKQDDADARKSCDQWFREAPIYEMLACHPIDIPNNSRAIIWGSWLTPIILALGATWIQF